MLKTILLMRHAEAEHGHTTLSDFDRCLTDDGCETAQRTGACLKALGIQIDRIVASSAIRTRQTAEFVASGVCPAATMVFLDGLYNATADSFASCIRMESPVEESSVLVVGHNPGIAGLMCHWAEQSLSVPPATLAIYQLQSSDWTGIRLSTSSPPQLVCIVQDGKVLRQEPSFKNPLRFEE